MKRLSATGIERMLAPGPRMAAAAEPVMRLATSVVFIVGGLGHFVRHDEMLARIADSPWRSQVALIGDPSVLLWLSGAVFAIFGAMLALGWLVRLSAILLFATLVPVTVAIHAAPGHTGPLLKNVAILGALYFLYARETGPAGALRSSAP